MNNTPKSHTPNWSAAFNRVSWGVPGTVFCSLASISQAIQGDGLTATIFASVAAVSSGILMKTFADALQEKPKTPPANDGPL